MPDNRSMKQIILVTGAGSGLGREFARQMPAVFPADELWLFARTESRLEETAETVRKETEKAGIKILPRVFPGSLTGRTGVAAVENLLRQEAERCGGLCVRAFANNAGSGTYGPVMETETEDQMEMIELNAVTAAGLCRIAVPYMAAGSVILNTASLAAFAPLGNFAVYAATKAFLYSFSLALRAELADRGISVCAVCPGPVATNFAAVASNGARMEVKGGADPVRVAAHAIRAACKGKAQALCLPKWKIKAFLSRLIPRYAFARWTYLHEKRPRKKKDAPRE